MLYFAIVIGLLMICLSLYIFFFYKAKKKTVLILKMVTSIWFVVLGILSTFLNEEKNIEFSIIMLMGLLCGFLGDALLGLRGVFPHHKKIYFLLGLFMFFVGHIFYCRVLITLGTFKPYVYFFFSIVATLIAIFVLEITNLDLGKLRIPNYIYIFISSLLLGIACFNLIEARNKGTIISFFGVLFFVASDFILCYLYFKKIEAKTYKTLKLFNIITYYLGQVLLALSIYFVL